MVHHKCLGFRRSNGWVWNKSLRDLTLIQIIGVYSFLLHLSLGKYLHRSNYWTLFEIPCWIRFCGIPLWSSWSPIGLVIQWSRHQRHHKLVLGTTMLRFRMVDLRCICFNNHWAVRQWMLSWTWRFHSTCCRLIILPISRLPNNKICTLKPSLVSTINYNTWIKKFR